MSFNFDRNEILKILPKCGDCINCKLIVWDAEAAFKGATAKYTIKTKIGVGKAPQLMVRCNWLKTAIEQPDRLQVCDGWRDINSPVDRRDREY